LKGAYQTDLYMAFIIRYVASNILVEKEMDSAFCSCASVPEYMAARSSLQAFMSAYRQN